MRRTWHDFQAHGRAAVLFLLYWLATLAVERMTNQGGDPDWTVVLLLTTPLIAGALVGWWRGAMPEPAHRSRDRITGGMLVGVLSVAITMVVIKGGVIEEVIGGIRGDPYFQGGEMLVFVIVGCVLGALLGSAGAALAMILDRFRRHGRPAPST
jgi:hypothetical protein